MNQKIFYQSSLPRAGSTLLQNIMGQNPLFHVTPTSGMIDMMLGTRIGYNGNTEAKAGDKDKWREGFYAYRLRIYVARICTPSLRPVIAANKAARLPPASSYFQPKRLR